MCAELLSTYCDTLLKATGEKLSDDALEDKLEKVVRLFTYLRCARARVWIRGHCGCTWGWKVEPSPFHLPAMLHASHVGITTPIPNDPCSQRQGHVFGVLSQAAGASPAAEEIRVGRRRVPDARDAQDAVRCAVHVQARGYGQGPHAIQGPSAGARSCNKR